MDDKYTPNPDAYKNRLAKEKNNPAFRSKIKDWEKNIADQPTFNTENEALQKAIEMTKKGEECLIFQAPKELGGKWKVISWEDHNGMGPESANQLGWSMIYDSQMLYDEVHGDVDHIEEV